MLESLVDLTYRGISLSRRIKLTQIRPSSGYLELPAPMPVGTELAVAADDGVVFEATVSWIHEQVTGSDRPPGMTIVPRLAGESASSWWQARVALSDDDAARPGPGHGIVRNRPVTVRPRTHTRPTPPPAMAGPGLDTPAIIADLGARVAAAAGVRPPAPAAVAEPRAAALDGELSRPGEHTVVDDGAKTLIMQAVDPANLDLEPGTSGAMLAQSPPADDDAAGGDAPDPDGPGPAPATGRASRKQRR